ncbi:MAG: hypothetical protein LBD20_07220, partial [Spirochaetaceae bacterium]|nr:hypothetical protein [Spirochaetaceae bacterium]
SYTVEAVNGSTKTYLVRITHPVLPPLTAANHDGYVVTTEGRDGLYYSNVYYLLDNNLDTFVCYNNTGIITVTWESGAKPANRIRVLVHNNPTHVGVEFKNSLEQWVTVAPYTLRQPGEFIQTIPQSMDIIGVRITTRKVDSWRPRISEFVIE